MEDLTAWLTQIWHQEASGIREALSTGEHGVSQFDLDRLEADRQILELHRAYRNRLDFVVCFECSADSDPYIDQVEYPCTTIRLLAQPYAGRSGYRDEWAVR